MYELEYDSVYGVYKVVFGEAVVLTGTDDLAEAEAYAEYLITEIGVDYE